MSRYSKYLTLKQFERRHKSNLKKELTMISAHPCFIAGEDYIVYEFKYGIRTGRNEWKTLDSFDVLISGKEIKFVKFEELFKKNNGVDKHE